MPLAPQIPRHPWSQFFPKEKMQPHFGPCFCGVGSPETIGVEGHTETREMFYINLHEQKQKHPELFGKIWGVFFCSFCFCLQFPKIKVPYIQPLAYSKAKQVLITACLRNHGEMRETSSHLPTKKRLNIKHAFCFLAQDLTKHSS